MRSLHLFVAFSVVVFVSHAPGQTPPPLPQPTVGSVTITGPVQAGEGAYRTSNQVIPLTFTSDASNGRFVATSQGGDISFGMFLATGGAGQVAVGFNVEGSHSVTVLISSVQIGPGVPVAAASAPVTIILDRTPPVATISQIKVNEDEGFVVYSPTKIYYTNQDQVVLKGMVSDQNTPGDQVTIAARGVPGNQETQADSSGQWELTVDISGFDDGPIDLKIVALEMMSDGTISKEGPPMVVKVGQ